MTAWPFPTPKPLRESSVMPIPKHASQNMSGKYIDFIDPQPDQFNYEDIAYGLSRECRFNGQTAQYYSVAQHSVLASLLVPKEYGLAALIHDGSEAFMRDICSPLKALLPDYARLERVMQGVIHEYFGLPRELPADMKRAVKRIDLLLTATERAQLMPDDARDWPGVPNIQLPIKIQPMNEKEAREYFMDRVVSIMEDVPFLREIELWNSQHEEWLSRQTGVNLETPARDRTRLAG